MLQDYIYIPSDGLQKFVNLAEQYPKTGFTAPKGLTNDASYSGEVKFDWREFGELREVDAPHFEMDWAAIPRQAFFDVGGYDETFDKGWSWENVEIALRMQQAGYKFMVDPTNKAIGFDHNKFEQHPFNRPDNLNADRFQIVRQGILDGNYKLDFLK